MVAKVFSLLLLIIAFFIIILSGRTESQPSIDQHYSSNQRLEALHEGDQSGDEYQIKLPLEQYCGNYICASNMNEKKFVIDGLDYHEVKYSDPL